MDKYFYKDRLEALWMNNKFGMEFIEPLPYEILQKPEEGKGEVYHIHPNSLKIFEPKDGDLCELWGSDHHFRNITGDIAEIYKVENGWRAVSFNEEIFIEFNQITKIINRKGINFIWPKVNND